MTNSLLVVVVSGLVVAGCFGFGRYVRDNKGLKQRQRVADYVGRVAALSLMIFLEALLQHSHGVSFFEKLQDGQTAMVLAIFLAGAVLGVVYEYVGQFTFRLWHYPSAESHRVLFLTLPLFWGIFMFIMQDAWALLRGWGVDAWLAVLLASIVTMTIIEGINLLTNSWVYRRWVDTMQALSLGWILLTLTFVVGYNYYFSSPFGF